MAKPIRLKAENLDDLQVISTLLQDAALRIDGISYQPKAHRFAFVANRFRWEHQKNARTGHERVRSGLRFEGVLNAGFQNLPLSNKDQVVSLLALEAAKRDKDFLITLVFAGGGAIRLETEMIEVYLEDLTGPWGTRRKPIHPVAE